MKKVMSKLKQAAESLKETKSAAQASKRELGDITTERDALKAELSSAETVKKKELGDITSERDALKAELSTLSTTISTSEAANKASGVHTEEKHVSEITDLKNTLTSTQKAHEEESAILEANNTKLKANLKKALTNLKESMAATKSVEQAKNELISSLESIQSTQKEAEKSKEGDKEEGDKALKKVLNEMEGMKAELTAAHSADNQSKAQVKANSARVAIAIATLEGEKKALEAKLTSTDDQSKAQLKANSAAIATLEGEKKALAKEKGDLLAEKAVLAKENEGVALGQKKAQEETASQVAQKTVSLEAELKDKIALVLSLTEAQATAENKYSILAEQNKEVAATAEKTATEVGEKMEKLQKQLLHEQELSKKGKVSEEKLQVSRSRS